MWSMQSGPVGGIPAMRLPIIQSAASVIVATNSHSARRTFFGEKTETSFTALLGKFVLQIYSTNLESHLLLIIFFGALQGPREDGADHVAIRHFRFAKFFFFGKLGMLVKSVQHELHCTRKFKAARF